MRFREVAYHQIPDAYARQTLARAEEVYGYDGPDPDMLAYWDEQDEADSWWAWAVEQVERQERFVDESDVDRPDEMQILAANGHVYHVSPAR